MKTQKCNTVNTNRKEDNKMIEKKAWTPKEFSQSWGICLTNARRIINKPDFPKIVLGRRIIIPIEPATEYMNKQMQIGA